MSKFTWKSNSAVKRHPGNPILAAKDMPYPSTLVYNPGVTKFEGRYVMLFRNLHYQVRWSERTHFLGWAFSEDGLKWEVDKEARFEAAGLTFAADPRLTVLEGRCYVTCAEVSKYGIRGVVAVSDDLKKWEVLSVSAPDNRNMVLFPEKVGGKFVRLERPFPVYGRKEKEAFDIWYSDSPDGRYWGNTQRVLGHESLDFCNTKVGPAGPPIKTEKGWLTLFHATHEDPETVYPTWRDENWHKLYCVGVMLLDLENPAKVVGLARKPLMVPEEPYRYETEGYRSHTLFPTGTVLEPDGTVRIYYGACDTVICLATAKLEDLVAMCEPV